MKSLRAKSWSPYAVGVGIGVLSWFAFATADHGLGITTPFEYAAGLVAGGAAYLADHQPKIDWEWMVVLGVFLGSFVSSKLSGDRNHATFRRCGAPASAIPSASACRSPSPAAS